jgi:hypothetical protein
MSAPGHKPAVVWDQPYARYGRELRTLRAMAGPPPLQQPSSSSSTPASSGSRASCRSAATPPIAPALAGLDQEQEPKRAGR